MSGNLNGTIIAGWSLAAALAVVGLHEVSGMAFEPAHLEHEKWGMAVEAQIAADTGTIAPEAPIDWGTVLPAADVAAGEVVFAKCASCHKVDDTNGTGPGLNGIVGRKPASHAGFAYSPAMVEYGAAHPQWTYDELSAFLKKPGAHISGTKMTFVGLKNVPDRVNVIAFLRTKGSALPIPAPDPARAPAAAAPAEGAAPAAAAGAPAAAAPAAPAPEAKAH